MEHAPVYRSRHTVAYLRSHVPEFILPENWPSNTPDLNFVDYWVWTALPKMECRNEISDTNSLKHVLIDCWDSAKSGHIEPGDQSAAKKTWWLSRWRVPMLNFVWTNSVCRWSLLLLSLHVWVKTMHSVKFSIILGVVNIYANKAKNI